MTEVPSKGPNPGGNRSRTVGVRVHISALRTMLWVGPHMGLHLIALDTRACLPPAKFSSTYYLPVQIPLRSRLLTYNFHQLF